jgi:hypothetical protein
MTQYAPGGSVPVGVIAPPCAVQVLVPQSPAAVMQTDGVKDWLETVNATTLGWSSDRSNTAPQFGTPPPPKFCAPHVSAARMLPGDIVTGAAHVCACPAMLVDRAIVASAATTAWENAERIGCMIMAPGRQHRRR